MKDTNHSVIHTGGNVYNDIIADIDKTGRIIVVSEGGIRLFASDRDYQCGCNPLVWASSPESPYEAICADCGEPHAWDEMGMDCKVCVKGLVVSGAGLEPCEDSSQIADIESTTQYVFVRDIEGATLTVWRDNQ